MSSSDKHNTPPCLPSQKATIAIPDNKSPLHPRSIGITEQGLGPGEEEERDTERDQEEIGIGEREAGIKGGKVGAYW